jgi:N-acetylglucosamine-6-sulfatase
MPDRATRAALALAAALGCGSVSTPPAHAQPFDCEDVDHDCDPADRTVASGLKRVGAALVECARHAVDPCDLTFALAKVTDEQCRDAIECQVRALFAQVGDGGTLCVQQLFEEGYRFMSKNASWLRHERLEAVVDGLARCKERGGRHCVDPIAPPLGDTCAGKTAPAAGAGCVCDAADALSNRMLLKPPTCIEHPPAPCSVRTVPAPRPNFVIILSDDQRWDTVDATHQVPGRPGYVMPHVKSELTDSGVTFTEGYVTTSLCCPSRTSILTGEYAHDTGIHDNSPPDGGAEVFDDHCTLARWLKAQGYKTGFVGKYLNGYASLSPCIPPGYDDWHVQVQVRFYDYDLNDNGTITHHGSDPADYSGDVMTRKAVDFIHAAGAEGRRFFLHVSQKAPHAPATPAPRHLGLFAGIAPFRPPNYGEADVSDKPAWVQSLTWDARGCAACPPGKQCDACETDEFRQKQLESLQAVDEGVASIMGALRDIGQDASTLVIYTSDNGFSWGSHRWKPKTCPYEECIRVPMIMRYPDLVAGAPRTDGRIVLNIDFAPTIAELAGVVPDTLVNGRSVAPLLDDTAASWRTVFLNEHWNGKIPDNGLVKGKVNGTTWKYVEYVTGERELYGLDPDPYELSNRWNDPTCATEKNCAAAKATLPPSLHDLQAQ